MPRSFDSDDVRAQQSPVLRFEEYVDCPKCCTELLGSFFDESMAVEDIVEPPKGLHACPDCGHVWTSRMTGWTFFSEAG